MKRTLGFIGLGVMGEPICRNLTQKSGHRMVAFDTRLEPLQNLRRHGVEIATHVAVLAEQADLVFLSLPGGQELEQVCSGEGGLLGKLDTGCTVVDLSTVPVALTRDLADRFTDTGVDYADAPVARTRAAAETGTLSIMVGGSAKVFERIQPLLSCCASEITHCGPVGSGQIVKLMNNMVLFQTVVALAEALTIARRAGMDGQVLFETFSKGSADSFALHNHGMKALLSGEFPERAFSTEYARKDLVCAMELAAQVGLTPNGAEATRKLLAAASESGYGEEYFPCLIKVIEENIRQD